MTMAKRLSWYYQFIQPYHVPPRYVTAHDGYTTIGPVERGYLLLSFYGFSGTLCTQIVTHSYALVEHIVSHELNIIVPTLTHFFAKLSTQGDFFVLFVTHAQGRYRPRTRQSHQNAKKKQVQK